MDIREKDITEINNEALTEASISNGILRNVAIMSSNVSKNNRKYSQLAMEQITGFLEGCKCFVDHPASANLVDGIRSVRDLCGTFKNGRKEGNKIIADLKIGGRFEQLFSDLISLGGGTGMSINSKVKVYQPKGGMEEVVECISLPSVDVVSSPAMVSGFKESKQNKSDKKEVLEGEALKTATNEFLGIAQKPSKEVDEFVKRVRGDI